MHYSAITTIVMGALLAGATADEIVKRQSYYWSASQPGGNGGWPDYTHSMIIPSMSAGWGDNSAAYPSASYISAYPSADSSYYSSYYYPSYSTVYYSNGGSTVIGSPQPTPRPGGNYQNNGNPNNGLPESDNDNEQQLHQASPNAGSSLTTGGTAFFALGALTGIAAFLL